MEYYKMKLICDNLIDFEHFDTSVKLKGLEYYPPVIPDEEKEKENEDEKEEYVEKHGALDDFFTWINEWWESVINDQKKMMLCIVILIAFIVCLCMIKLMCCKSSQPNE